MTDMNKTRYTHRDYESIKADLINAIPSLTQEWTSRGDSDPGIVLIKLMSMFGDNLSYNMDKMALELYLDTVTQRKNCAKILELLGYKMHWYRSAKVVINCKLLEEYNFAGNPESCVLTPFVTKFKAGDIYYTMVPQEYGTGSIEITSSERSTPIKLVQGIIQEVSFNSADLVNNRYYFAEKNIDESHFWMTYGSRHSCVLVDSLYSEVSPTNVTFEFNIDEYDNPYIELINSWQDIVGANTNTMSSNNFTLKYLISQGAEGTITTNAFTSVIGASNNSNLTFTNLSNNSIEENSNDIEYNTPGYNPQTVDEAKDDAKKYVLTHNTLVSPSDFEKAVKRVENITASKLVDSMVIDREDLSKPDVLSRARDYFGEFTYDRTYKTRVRNIIPFPEYADGMYKEQNGIIFTVDENTGEIRATGSLKDINTRTSFVIYDSTRQPLLKLERNKRYYVSGLYNNSDINEVIISYKNISKNTTSSDTQLVTDPDSFDSTPKYEYFTTLIGSDSSTDIYCLDKLEIVIKDPNQIDNIYQPQVEKNTSQPTEYEPAEITFESVVSCELSAYEGILYLGYQDMREKYNAYAQVTGSSDRFTISGYDISKLDQNSPEYRKIVELGYYPYKIPSYIQLQVSDELMSNKIMNTSIEYGTVKLFPFKVNGVLYLTEPMTPFDCVTLITNIDESLKAFFNPSKHSFGDKPSFLDIVDTIQKTSTKVKYFDAISSIVEYNMGCDLEKTFDTTSFVIYDGLSNNFNLAPAFLKYKIRNISTEDIELENLSTAKELEVKIKIGAQQTVELDLDDIDELKALNRDMQETSYSQNLICIL